MGGIVTGRLRFRRMKYGSMSYRGMSRDGSVLTASLRVQVKPLTCIPHHRDRANPKDIGTNDAMGEFSLTAIDALSSMAVMAASDEVEAQRFWETAEELVRIYW